MLQTPGYHKTLYRNGAQIMTHSKDDKRVYVLNPENKDKDFSDGINQLKKDALNTTKAKDVKLDK